MSDAIHLLIPFATASAADCTRALEDLRLPVLQRLLARMQAQPADGGQDHDLSMPHERALARAIGLPAGDGLIA